MASAKANGIRLHYAESGGGDNLVILLHGFPEFWYSWRHQLTVLGTHFHVVAPDMRGDNLSDKPPPVEDYSTDVLAKDVIGLIDHFGGGKAAIVGHDWGRRCSLGRRAKASRTRFQTRSITSSSSGGLACEYLAAPVAQKLVHVFLPASLVPEWAIRRNSFRGLDRVFKEKVIRTGSFTDADVEIYKEALRQPGALTGAINYYRANFFQILRVPKTAATTRPPGEKETRKGGRIRVPTLFIFGEQDFAILPQTVRGIADYIDAPYRELRIPDSGHWVQNEAVE